MFASQRVEINCGLEAQATLLKTDFIREKFQVFKPQWIKQELITLGNRLGEFELIKRHQNLIVVNFQYCLHGINIKKLAEYRKKSFHNLEILTNLVVYEKKTYLTTNSQIFQLDNSNKRELLTKFSLQWEVDEGKSGAVTAIIKINGIVLTNRRSDFLACQAHHLLFASQSELQLLKRKTAKYVNMIDALMQSLNFTDQRARSKRSLLTSLFLDEDTMKFNSLLEQYSTAFTKIKHREEELFSNMATLNENLDVQSLRVQMFIYQQRNALQHREIRSRDLIHTLGLELDSLEIPKTLETIRSILMDNDLAPADHRRHVVVQDQEIIIVNPEYQTKLVWKYLVVCLAYNQTHVSSLHHTYLNNSSELTDHSTIRPLRSDDFIELRKQVMLIHRSNCSWIQCLKNALITVNQQQMSCSFVPIQVCPQIKAFSIGTEILYAVQNLRYNELERLFKSIQDNKFDMDFQQRKVQQLHNLSKINLEQIENLQGNDFYHFTGLAVVIGVAITILLILCACYCFGNCCRVNLCSSTQAPTVKVEYKKNEDRVSLHSCQGQSQDAALDSFGQLPPTPPSGCSNTPPVPKRIQSKQQQ